jgi:hypothetical protein
MSPKKKNRCKENLLEILEAIEKELEKIKIDCADKIEKLKSDYTREIKVIKENYNRINSNGYIQENETPNNTEISRPVYYGNNKDQHPKDFLNRLEEYFAIKQTYVGEKIIIVGDCLKAAAYNWFSTIRFQLCNYEDFKRVFMDEYWSREIQIQIWSQCLNTTQIPPNVSYREHFANWANKLRHLETPKLSEAEIVKNIATHYPR